jgi:hypothetical protein
MLETLVNFVSGAMAEYFRQKQTRPLYVFTATFLFFTAASGIGIPLLSDPSEAHRDWGSVARMSVGIGTLMGSVMIALQRLGKPRRTAASERS